MKNYTWEQINASLMETGHSPKQILNVLSKLNQIKKEFEADVCENCEEFVDDCQCEGFEAEVTQE